MRDQHRCVLILHFSPLSPRRRVLHIGSLSHHLSSQ